MQLTDLITAGRVKVPLAGRTKDEVLRELVELAVREHGPDVVASVATAVREREQLLSTGSGGGVEVPWSDRHLRLGGRGFSRSKPLTPSRAERRMIPV